MDATTGIFTAPKSGFYNFNVNGVGTDAVIELVHNDQSVGSTPVPNTRHHYGNSQESVYALSSTLKLSKGDRIHIALTSGEARNNYFTGMLVAGEELD